MTNLNARQALRKSITLWLWLSENPTADKADAYENLGFDPDIYDCSLCTYAQQQISRQGDHMCNHCLVWPTDYDNSISSPHFGCLEHHTPFHRWRVAQMMKKPSLVESSALDMVDLLRQVLSEQ